MQYRLNENGVLSVKSASACSKRMVDGEIIPMDEWFETGDILEEKDGRYYVLGRLGDVVIGENGENINPDVVEQVFDVHEALNFSVLGLKKDILSMVVSLPAEITEEEAHTLMQRIIAENGTLPLSHQVKEFYFTYDAIMPETAIKVGRKYLLRGIENGSIKLIPFAEFKVDLNLKEEKKPLTSEVARKVREIIAEGAGCKPEEVGDDDHLMNDLGCDSPDLLRNFDEGLQRIRNRSRRTGCRYLLYIKRYCGKPEASNIGNTSADFAGAETEKRSIS